MNLKGCFSKETDNWKTPSNLYNFFIECGYIDTFPYKAEYDEFEKNYFNEKLFINPPFSKMKEVTEWIYRQFENNNHIILLIPVRSDTQYFQKLLALKPSIWFVKGRLKYNDYGTAPFPSIIMSFAKYSIIPYYLNGSVEEFINNHQKWRKLK